MPSERHASCLEDMLQPAAVWAPCFRLRQRRQAESLGDSSWPVNRLTHTGHPDTLSAGLVGVRCCPGSLLCQEADLPAGRLRHLPGGSPS